MAAKSLEIKFIYMWTLCETDFVDFSEDLEINTKK